jgi:hypothetical protein
MEAASDAPIFDGAWGLLRATRYAMMFSALQQRRCAVTMFRCEQVSKECELIDVQ